MVTRWRRNPPETGLRAVVAGPRGHQLYVNGEPVLSVSAKGGYGRTPVEGWYWYGMGQNTAHAPCPTAEEAKAEAMAFYRASQYLTRIAADRSEIQAVIDPRIHALIEAVYAVEGLELLQTEAVEILAKVDAAGGAAALAILSNAPDTQPEKMTRAEVRTMWLAVVDAQRALRLKPESVRHAAT